MSGYVHAKWQNQLLENFDVYLYAKNKPHHSIIFWDITFQRILQYDWLSIFPDKLRTRILPDIGLVMKYQ